MASEVVVSDQPKGLEEMFEKLSMRLDKRLDENNTTMKTTMETKFDECSDKFDAKIDVKFLEVQEKLGSMKENITHIETSLSTVIHNQSTHKLKQEEYETKLNSLEIKCLKMDQAMKEQVKKNETYDTALTFANSEIETLKKQVENQKQDQRIDRSRIQGVEKKCNNQEFKDEAKEQQSRKMNLWIYGIDQVETDEDTWGVVCEFGSKVLKLESEFIDNLMFKGVHRVGGTKNSNRPIIVAFVMAKDRMKFLKAASSLYTYNKTNNTKYGVKTDLAPKARAERKRLTFASNNWRRATGKILSVRNNDNGKVWMVTKPNHESSWRPVGYVDPKWFMEQQAPQVMTGNEPMRNTVDYSQVSSGGAPPTSTYNPSTPIVSASACSEVSETPPTMQEGPSLLTTGDGTVREMGEEPPGASNGADSDKSVDDPQTNVHLVDMYNTLEESQREVESTIMSTTPLDNDVITHENAPSDGGSETTQETSSDSE